MFQSNRGRPEVASGWRGRDTRSPPACIIDELTEVFARKKQSSTLLPGLRVWFGVRRSPPLWDCSVSASAKGRTQSKAAETAALHIRPAPRRLPNREGHPDVGGVPLEVGS